MTKSPEKDNFSADQKELLRLFDDPNEKLELIDAIVAYGFKKGWSKGFKEGQKGINKWYAPILAVSCLLIGGFVVGIVLFFFLQLF